MVSLAPTHVRHSRVHQYSGHSDHRYLVYVPIVTERPRAVLCFLHGAGEAARNKQRAEQPIDKLLANESPAWHAENGSPWTRGLLVVCPQLEARRRWRTQDAGWVNALLDAEVAFGGGDAAPLNLTGFSYGGEGVFILAANSPPKRWTTLWAVDPAVDGENAPPTPRPSTSQRVCVHHGSDRKHVTDAALRTFLVTDSHFDAASPTHTRRLTVLEADHETTCVLAYRDAAAWRWLFYG